MSKVDLILKEIDDLSPDERNLLFQEIFKKVKKMEHILSILSRYKGIGKGIWNQDAQQYINDLRKNDRI